MEAAVAETIVQTTREQAVSDARADLTELRRLAINAGRERSRQITKTSRIDFRSGEIRYNPAGRLLRDWYFHGYLNTLRAGLSEPSVPIDAQQVEDTTALLRKVRPTANAEQALRAVAVMRNVAFEDAAHSVTRIVTSLYDIGPRRAIRHAPDDRFDGDELSVHIIRHWYVRAYEDHVHRTTDTQQPLTQVTAVEEALVAEALHTGLARELIGADGVPRFTAHGAVLTDIDRMLAAGVTGLVTPVAGPQLEMGERTLRQQVVATWSALDTQSKEQWLRSAGVTAPLDGRRWSALEGHEQSAVINLHLRNYSAAHADVPFAAPVIDRDPSDAARLMFGHSRALRQTERSVQSPPVEETGGDRTEVNRTVALEHSMSSGQ